MQRHLLNLETIILSERLVIRRFREQDGEAFFKLAQNNRSRLEDRFPAIFNSVRAVEEASYYAQCQIAHWLTQIGYSFAIWENNSANIIGYIEIQNIDWNIPSGELIFFIDQEFEGKGLMTEAMNKIIPFIFEDLKLAKVNFLTAADNYAAQRLVRKCGFRREGDIRMALKKGEGEAIDAMLLGLSMHDYFKV